ncbi:MAG: hypothetical protein CMQ14_00295, partial [Gammaproteobacteria bacterium]|nr:hypothetical protein [Gammaproteobacteria bacterium]
ATQDFLNFTAHGIADFMLDIRLLNPKLLIFEFLHVFLCLVQIAMISISITKGVESAKNPQSPISVSSLVYC